MTSSLDEHPRSSQAGLSAACSLMSYSSGLNLSSYRTGSYMRLVLDLDDVTLVDASVLRFLVACEAGGIELLNCAPYIRKWISRGHDRRT